MLRPLAPVIVYYANYDYIANELCENRNKPILDCNGICYLNTMIAEDNTQPNGDPITTVPLNMNDYPISTLDFYKYSSLFLVEDEEQLKPVFRKDFIISEYNTDIFHPPQFV